MDKPLSNVAIRDWPGLVTASDRADVPPGAGVFQVNLQSERSGEMRVRRGIAMVSFELTYAVVVADSVAITETIQKPVNTSDTVTIAESIAVALT